jgi:hypothetical protein
MSTATIDYDALAKQFGAVASNPAPSSPSSSQPPLAGNGGVDYDALAAQFGAVNQSAVGTGQTTNDTGSTVIIPKEEESFDDTMKRAAAFGQTAQAKAQAAKESTPQNLGTKAAETLAAAPVAGAAGAAGLAGAGELGALTPQAVTALKAVIQAHPTIAKVVFGGIGVHVAAKLGILKELTDAILGE